MNAIILGDRSDIAMALKPMLEADGYDVIGWHRGGVVPNCKWDLVLCAIGQVAPVGHWSEVSTMEWAECVNSNVIMPVWLLQHLWPNHNPGASVCFLAGANPNKAPPNYSAYATGKMALLKAVEHMDAETPDAKMFCLAPGIVFTKIHNATMASGIRNEGLEERRKVGGTPMEKIYECLKWCIRAKKEVVGGRNICVSDDPHGRELDSELLHNQGLFKLRRVER